MNTQNDHPGHFAELDEEHKKQVADLTLMLDKSKDFLSEEKIANIKRILAKMNKKTLERLKDAVITKQLSAFKDIEVLDENNESE